MRTYLNAQLLLFFFITSIIPASPLFEEHHDICLQLEQLWLALYGPHHRLKSYISAYHHTLSSAQRLYQTTITRSAADPATELMLNDLLIQLNTIKEKAAGLLNSYVITPVMPLEEPIDPLTMITSTAPTTPIATPTTTPTATDALLQQLLNAMQQLTPPNTPDTTNSLLQQQVILFVSGIIVLGLTTAFFHYKLSPSCKKLQAAVTDLRHQYHAPHPMADGEFTPGQTGILGELDHLHYQLTTAGATQI